MNNSSHPSLPSLGVPLSEEQAEQATDEDLVVEDHTVGPLIAGRYRPLYELGRGAGGKVLACTDTLLNGWPVALKVFPRELFADYESVLAFEREVSAMQFIKHSNVATFYDVVIDQDVVGFTMEYVPGGSLRDALDEGVLFSPRQVLRLIIQLCSGLRAIHRTGVIHRDLKPENILFGQDGLAKIVDFGVSIPSRRTLKPKDTGSHRVYRFHKYMERMTSDEAPSAGTLDYMSPEQLVGEGVSYRADIYALGTIAYELLTGKAPYADYEMPRAIWAKANVDATPVIELRENCPYELNYIVMTAIERDQRKRFRSSVHMLNALWTLDCDLEYSGRYSRYRARPRPSRLGRIMRFLFGGSD